jgi:uncharacterized membrane protein
MSTTVAHRSWPVPSSAQPAPGWRFGRDVSGGGQPGALQWVLKRNCSITPRQLGAVYLSLCVLAVAISAGFWMQGAPVVTVFAAIELLCVGIAILVYARHAGDREVLTLVGRELAVETRQGSRTESHSFGADWLVIEPSAGQGSLVELSGRGRAVRVGRFLRPELRAAFAQELRRALRSAGSPEHTTGYELT